MRAEEVTGGPVAVVLGVAQDGGLPHLGCHRECCEAARRDPSRRRRVACLGLVAAGRAYLIDATPDLPSQAGDLVGHRGPSDGPMKPIDGVFLTHGHFGHYLGLAYLGREGAWTLGVPVWGTERMLSFLGANAPWDQLVKMGNIHPTPIGDGVDLPGGLRVEAIPVPHRAEYTDTVGYLARGPGRSVVYLPDIDSWDGWDRDLAELVAGVDRAYLDGAFWSDDELPGRDMAKVPHPRVKETMERLGDLPSTERLKVRFLHINHTNPLHDPASPERHLVEEAGMAVAAEGEWFPL
jgi:pyrroloquinoline quinone biosynthesis protein B